MRSSLRGLTALVALSVVLALAGNSQAQALYVAPTPVVSYYAPPAVSYYYTPSVSYYSAPAVSYYTPAVSYYAPAVSYYYAPAVSYYAPPAVSYYPPTASVTTYRGILPWRRATVTNYYTPTYFYP
jgi:hypothetical protein